MRYYPPATDRFNARVDRSNADGCWPWTGPLDATGYGNKLTDGDRRVAPHRLAWELVNGPIPAGLVIDHLCRNRACCNPAHLEPVTIGENVLRGETITAACAAKTHCVHGHKLTGDNVRIWPSDGSRRCLICVRRRRNETAQRRRAQRRAPEGTNTNHQAESTQAHHD